MADGSEAPRPILCAGQECDWRTGCARFRTRHSGARWASFDIERLHFEDAEGDPRCPQHLPVARPVTVKKHYRS